MCREPAFRHSRGARGRVSLGFSRRCFWQSRRPQSQLSLGEDIALEHLVPTSRCGNAWHFHYRYSGNDVSRVPKQLSRLRTREDHSAEHLAGRETKKRPSSLVYYETGYELHSPCQRPLPGRYSRRTDLGGRRREKVLDLLEDGQGGGVKVFLEVGPTPVLQEPPTSDPQKLRRRLPHMVNKESGWPEPGNNLKP